MLSYCFSTATVKLWKIRLDSSVVAMHGHRSMAKVCTEGSRQQGTHMLAPAAVLRSADGQCAGKAQHKAAGTRQPVGSQELLTKTVATASRLPHFSPTHKVYVRPPHIYAGAPPRMTNTALCGMKAVCKGITSLHMLCACLAVAWQSLTMCRTHKGVGCGTKNQ